MKLSIGKTREKENRNGLELLIDLESRTRVELQNWRTITDWNYRTRKEKHIVTQELQNKNRFELKNYRTREQEQIGTWNRLEQTGTG